MFYSGIIDRSAFSSLSVKCLPLHKLELSKILLRLVLYSVNRSALLANSLAILTKSVLSVAISSFLPRLLKMDVLTLERCESPVMVKTGTPIRRDSNVVVVPL